MMIHFFRKNNSLNTTNSVFVSLLLFLSSTVYAEEWYSIAEDPGGKTTQPPAQLETYPLGKNTEKHFPPNMEISFVDGDNRQTLFYEKVVWTVDNINKGLRYGENPGQEAALFRLVNGNLILGETETIQPGRFLASDIELLQSGKHPGKTNLTDADNALNILRYFVDKPTVVIVKHNNPCGVARSNSLADAYTKANMADRIAAFGGCIALNRPVDRVTAERFSSI